MKSLHTNCLIALLAVCVSGLTSFPASGQAAAASDSQPGTAPSADVAQFQKIEDSWSTALVKQDQYGLENVLAPTYVGISAKGDVATRNQQIAHIFDREQSPQSMEQRVASVRLYTDLAVVNGTYIVGHKQSGQVMNEKGIFTHVYQRARNGGWLCINSQRTLVVDEGAQKTKTSAKKSNAELPFHIPLFHKGDDSAAQPASTAQPQPQ
jgi:ketosteroid isomerase-like protein